MLRQNLSQKLLQKLSPQQIQLMKLLQVPTDALEQRIKEELEVNPALEEMSQDASTFEQQEADAADSDNDGDTDGDGMDDSINLSDYFDETDDTAGYKTQTDYGNDDDEDRSMPIPINITFHESLLQQLGLAELDDHHYEVAKQLIGSIDEDGYIRRDLDAIVDDLAFSANIQSSVEELGELLVHVVQKLDPPGVGARDLRECLLLQLHRKEEKNLYINLAADILQEHFDEFSKKHYEKLQRVSEVDEKIIKKAIDEILKLNPKPGGAYNEGGAKLMQHIIPDFQIENNNGELILRLNARNAPELRVSESFKEMMIDYNKSKEKTKQQKEAVLFIKQKIDSAKWFIDAVKQRQQTLMKTMKAIMEHQYNYFLTGDETQLRPMILKDIALVTNLDISTVSRVANSKYVQTEFGTFLLKNFFAESLSTDSGEEVSTREVKKILEEHIGKESKRKPLSDQRLTEILNKAGYNIARRTVAKYREQLNIPVARLRKEL